MGSRESGGHEADTALDLPVEAPRSGSLSHNLVLDMQVQKELIDDNHPVLLVSGGDISRILIAAQIGGDGADDLFPMA